VCKTVALEAIGAKKSLLGIFDTERVCRYKEVVQDDRVVSKPQRWLGSGVVDSVKPTPAGLSIVHARSDLRSTDLETSQHSRLYNNQKPENLAKVGRWMV
jgi:hypothetical protein